MRSSSPLAVAALVTSCLQGTAAAQALPPAPLGLDVYMPVPAANPVTSARVALGEQLFFDPQLSADGTIACASCHQPARAFADARAQSRGVFGRHTSRNTPSLLNAGYRRAYFWDGRITSLEQQVLAPIVNPREMGSRMSDVIQRLAASGGYRQRFDAVFGSPPTETTLAYALATFVRAQRSGGSAADRFRAGDRSALDADATAGYALFSGKANCVQCHFGPLLSDDRFHNTGVSWGRTDTGRQQVTGRDEDRGRFRTPSLRDVALTAPYMHDGSMATLAEVVAYYDRGADPNPRLDPELRPLRLTPEERRQLVAFLRALTGDRH